MGSADDNAIAQARPRWLAPLLALLLFGLTAALYARTRHFDFLRYDDDVYVTDNPAVLAGLRADSVRWAFSSGHGANWHPLTWLAHMLDVELFGLRAGAHHLTSALLHAANAALLLLALRALTGALWRSALVAALFALHPLRAESVAWVAERKDVLAGTCFLATLWAYALYARRGGRGRYLLCLGCFGLGLLAKPMLVTVPCLLLVLDRWPLERWRAGGTPPASRAPRRLWLEKLPFFALALTSSWITLRVQQAGGAVGPLEVLGPLARLANALESSAIYVRQTLWPTGLCAFYPLPTIGHPELPAWTPRTLSAALLLLGLGLLAWRLRARLPALAVGWLWYLGMLVPVVGLVQVGAQAHADRYTYLPGIGLAIALVWGLASLARTAAARRWLAAGSVLVLGLLARVSAQQIDTWRNDRTLFERALAVTTDNDVAHVNLGEALLRAGEPEAACEHFRAALLLRPRLAPIEVNLARGLRLLGRTDEARAALGRALALDPDGAAAHAELGWLLATLGEDEQGLVHLRAAVAAAPEDLALRNNLAWVLATSRTRARPEEALGLARELCERTGFSQPGFLETLAAALARTGSFEEAAEMQSRALSGVPRRARPRLEERLQLYRSGRAFVKEP